MSYSANLLTNGEVANLTGWTNLGATIANSTAMGCDAFRLAMGASIAQTIDVSTMAGIAKVFVAIDSTPESIALQQLSWAKAEILIQGTNSTKRIVIPISTRRTVIFVHELEEELDPTDTLIAISFTVTADIAPIFVLNMKVMTTTDSNDTAPYQDSDNVPDSGSSGGTGTLVPVSLIDFRANGHIVKLVDSSQHTYTWTVVDNKITKITDEAGADSPVNIAWNNGL